ncbi:MAG: sugar phosphate isomerase/epimerase [Planctomycetes bacterium]|nr:sugar phosphate isomerase/epimerase [Planctomycetota bacterium]
MVNIRRWMALWFAVAASGAVSAQENVADGVLPGGNLVACETYSLRDLFKEQKPDPKKPWIGKYPQLTLETFPTMMKDLGLKGLAINDMYLPPNWDDAYLDKVKAAAKAEGRVIAAFIMSGGLATADEAARQRNIEAVQKKMRAAHRLGAPVVRIDLGGPGKGIDESVGVQNCIDSFKKLLPLAKELNIKMTIENHGGVSGKSENIIRIIEESDRAWVGSCLDFKNWPKEKATEECLKMVPYAYHIHAKSHAFKEDGEEAASDYKTILEALKKSGYKGPISIEFEGGGDPVEGVKKTRDLIIRHWK